MAPTHGRALPRSTREISARWPSTSAAQECRFKDVAYTDLSIKTRAVEEVSKHFKLQRLSDFYYSWGAGAADINHDNVLDVVSGPHVFYGPDYMKRSEIYLQPPRILPTHSPQTPGCSSSAISPATDGLMP